jgi:hypothetical protein
MNEQHLGTVPQLAVIPGPEHGEGFSADERGVEALLFADVVNLPGLEEPNLRCARCGAATAYVHHVDVRRGADSIPDHGLRVYPTTETALLGAEETASSGILRNHGATVTVVFYCEMGHYFALELGAHKGHSAAAVFSWDNVDVG